MDKTIRPRIKSTVQLSQFDNKVYFKSSLSAIEMEDPTGFVAALTPLLDGHQNIAEIEETLRSTYPNEIKHLNEAITALDEAYLLEDEQFNQPNALTDYDLKRWSRNTEFFGAYCKLGENKHDHQARLKNIRVTLFGLGGLGSHIIYDLVALGVRNMRAVDFDRIELSNLNRQILYSEKDIGKLKAEAAKERIYQFYEDANVEFVNRRIESTADVEAMIKDAEIVICVADKPKKEMQGWLNEACFKYNVPFINGGVENKCAMFATFIPGKTPCVECWKSHVERTNPTAHELLQREVPGDSPIAPGPALVPLVSLLTGLMVTEFLKLATGISTPKAVGKLLAVDFDSQFITEIETWDANPHCQTCSKLAA